MRDGNGTRATDHKGPPYVSGKADGYDLPPEIFKAELDAIGRRRGRPNTEQIPEPSVDRGLVGLALSGGGIRSAIFALGVMQRLAKEKLFEKFDYLSTVSGGGYIGSSITWLTSAKAEAESGKIFGVGSDDFPYGTDDPAATDGRTATTDQKGMLKYLRHHGNYLTPGRCITVTSLIAAVLRGILLNLLVWLPILVAVMVWLLEFSKETLGKKQILFNKSLEWSLYIAVFFLAVCVVYSIVSWVARGHKPWRYIGRRLFECVAGWLLWAIAVTLVVGSLPVVALALPKWIEGAGGPAAILLGLASGLWAYVTSGKTDGGRVPLGLIASVGAALFLYGILLMSYQMGGLIIDDYNGQTGQVTLLRLQVPVVYLWIVLIVAVVTGWCVNLNYISVHRYYRDRLMETFMPDIKRALKDETGPAKGADRAHLHEIGDAEEPRGPYHIVNTNVILVDSKDRRLRQRGGDNFILSPLYCGSGATGWRRTEKWMGGKMTLATAMAISGAAANPNTGVGGVGLTRNPMVSVLMALLNLRLGYWSPNPSWSWASRLHPPNHFHPGLYEILTVGYRRKRWYLQMSDGGHFENLAVYELVRRRCRVIVVCDGTADINFSFSDFQTLLRRIEADFDTRITFEGPENQPEKLIQRRDAGYPKGGKVADQGHIVGTITYPGGAKGTLIYLKTTMIRKLSFEVKGYQGANPSFPDQTTADQFFDEEQFEAYRELGYTIAKEMINDIRTNRDYDNKKGLREFIPFIPKTPRRPNDQPSSQIQGRK